MTLEAFIQIITTFFSGIGAWFIYDLIRDFKSFKSETKRDVVSLRQERVKFETTANQAALTIGVRVNEMQSIYNNYARSVDQSLGDIKFQTSKIKLDLEMAAKKSEAVNKFLITLLEVVKKHDSEINDLKVKMGEVIIFKNKKD